MRWFKQFLIGTWAVVGLLHVTMFVANHVPHWVISSPEGRGMWAGLVVGMLIPWILEGVD